MPAVICEGCWVQGDGPHRCDGEVQRPGVVISCTCGVDRTCRAWSTGDVYADLRSRANA